MATTDQGKMSANDKVGRCESTDGLTAFAEGRLDGRRKSDLAAHLGGCAECKVALARIEAARSTLRAIAEWAPPAAPAGSNARLEATLRWNRIDSLVETSERPRLGSWLPQTRIAWAAAAAVAAVAFGSAGFAAWHHYKGGAANAPAIELAVKPAPRPIAHESEPAPVAPVPPVVEVAEAVITLVSGDVRLVALDGSERPIDPARTLREGDHVVTGEGARLGFQWGEGSGALVESGGELRLTRLLPKAQELAIGRGRVAVRVGPHQPGESMRVRSPDHDVTVHGTWFIVGVQPRGGTTVEVLEGVVEVSATSGSAASTKLHAPSRAVFRRGSGIAEEERGLSGREATAIRGETEMGLLAWPGLGALLDGNGLLKVATDPPSQLVIDGVGFGATPLELRRPRGRHLLELSRAGFSTVRKWISVGDLPEEWDTSLRPEDKKIDSVEPAADEVKAVIGSRSRQIRACYDRVLKRIPTLTGTLTLELRIGGAGQVLGTKVHDDTLGDDQVSECVRHEAAGLLFQSARNARIVYPFVFRPM